MEILETIKGRRSIREYRAQMVEDEKLNAMLEAARWAPSAGNKQPWHFIVVRNAKTRAQLGNLHPHGRWMKDSPVVIVVLGDSQKNAKYYLCDPHNAVQNMLLMAYAQGLSTCWMGVRGNDFEEEMKHLLGVPSHMHLICTISVGYSDQTRSSTRFSLEELISWEHYGKRKSRTE